MDPKTFKAQTAKEVLAQISRELGPDAIIVSQRKIKDSEGILWVEATASPREESAVDTAAFPNALTSALKRKKVLMIGSMTAMLALIVAAAVIFWPRGGEVPTPKQKRIVVLPFENLGPPEDVYFADGITDEITTRLARMDELGVIARTSAYQYKNKDKGIQQIGDELEVDYVLEGTVRWQRSPDNLGRIRISPQLIRTDVATHVWAHIYEEDIADIFKVQSEIAEHVVDALGITMFESERESLKVKPTDNMEAYHFYLRGNEYSQKSFEMKDILLAIQMYEKAVELEPIFALAYAKLSRSHTAMYWFHDKTRERLKKAKQAVDKAFTLRPDMAEAHMAIGFYYYKGNYDYDLALKHFKIAQKTIPTDSELMQAFGLILRRQGKIEQALAVFKKSEKFEPRSPQLAFVIAETHGLLRNYSEAEKYFDRAISLSPDSGLNYTEKAEIYLRWEGSTKKARETLKNVPEYLDLPEISEISFDMAWLDVLDGKYHEALDWWLSSESQEANSFYKSINLAQIHSFMNQPELAKPYYESAKLMLEAYIQEHPDNNDLHGPLGIAYAGLGRKEEAIREGKLALELLPMSKDFWRAQYRVEDLAQIYTMVGEHELAIDQLEFLLSIPGELSIPLIRIDPKWNPLREYPRFKKLIKQGK